jgi:hypothetical protein
MPSDPSSQLKCRANYDATLNSSAYLQSGETIESMLKGRDCLAAWLPSRNATGQQPSHISERNIMPVALGFELKEKKRKRELGQRRRRKTRQVRKSICIQNQEFKYC